MHLALTLSANARPSGRPSRCVQSGLSVNEAPATPAWARATLNAETLTAAAVNLRALRETLAALSPDSPDDRSSAIDWVAHDESAMAVDLLLPLLVLARDLHLLGETEAEVVLDGA